jgi:hypothetical protein
LKITFFDLVAARDIQGVLKVTTVFILTVEKCINILKDCVNDAFYNNNNNENIAKIIYAEVKTAV